MPEELVVTEEMQGEEHGEGVDFGTLLGMEPEGDAVDEVLDAAATQVAEDETVEEPEAPEVAEDEESEETVAEDAETEEEPEEEVLPQPADLTALSSALGHHVEDVETAAQKVEELHQRVQDMGYLDRLLNESPEFVQALAEGASMAEAAASIAGVQLTAPDKLDDPDGYVEWKLAQEKAQARNAQKKELTQKQQKSIEKAQQQAHRALNAFGESVQSQGATFDIDEEAAAIRRLTSIGEDGRIDPQVFPAIYYGRRYPQISKSVTEAIQAAEAGKMDAVKESEGDFPLVASVKKALRTAYTNGARSVKDKQNKIETPPNLTSRGGGGAGTEESANSYSNLLFGNKN